MSAADALRAYREEKLNCAQSILRGFQKKYGLTEEQITEAKKYGGGRAEGGLCGALYAALLMADDAKKKQLRERFLAEAGADRCREIRAAGKLTCGGCVELAAKILDE